MADGNLNIPSARILAQHRQIATSGEYPSALADVMAERGVAVEAARVAMTHTKDLEHRLDASGTLNDAMRRHARQHYAQALAAGNDGATAVTQAVNAALGEVGEATQRQIHGVGGPRLSSNVGTSWDHGEGLRQKVQDGLTARLAQQMGLKHEPTVGREFATMQMGEMAMQMVRATGARPINHGEAIRMAVGSHSTSDFVLATQGSLENVLARGLEARTPEIERAARFTTRPDYRESFSLSLTESSTPQEVAEAGEIKYVTVDEKGEKNPVLRDFASGLAVSNKAIANDRIDLLGGVADAMLRAANVRKRIVMLEPIETNMVMRDGLAMFHADHGNLAASGGAPGVTTVGAAVKAMRTQKGPFGEVLAIAPAFLIVPPDLETVAQQVVAALTPATVGEVNPWAGKLEVLVEPGLTDPAAWYIAADPARFDGLVWATKDDMTFPVVESKPGWTTLGMEFRLVWALDATFIETATWYKNPGV
ncbi:hypothetical protein ACSSVY_001018 [Roseovarius sp. MBR-51]